MVVVGPESFRFTETRAVCSCGALSAGVLEVIRTRITRLQAGIVNAESTALAECYLCADCAKWAFGQAARARGLRQADRTRGFA